MLYYIDNTVATMIKTKGLSSEEIDFFSMLAKAYRQGKCYLCGDTESISLLSKTFSIVQGSAFSRVLSKHMEHGMMINAVKTVFVLTFSKNGEGVKLPIILKNSNKSKFISIQTAAQNGWNLENNCCLLCENLTDTTFFQQIGTYYCITHGYQALRLHFHCENGGGNTTAEVLEKCIIEDQTPTLCIIDSDTKYGKTKAYPQDPAKGDTLKAVISTINRIRKNTEIVPNFIKELSIHESENLIPIDILQRINPADSHGGIKILQQLLRQNRTDAILYYDYKNGFPYMKGQPKREYWQEVIRTLGGTENDMPPDVKPKGDVNTDKSTLFLPPIGGDKLLEKAVEYMRSNPVFQVDDYLCKHWCEIGETVFTWGCADEKAYG